MAASAKTFFIIDLSHQEREQHSYIYLYGITKEGKQLCLYEPFFAQIFLRLKDIDESKLLKILDANAFSYETQERSLLGVNEPFLRVSHQSYEKLQEFSKQVQEKGVEVLEDDVPITQQYLLAKHIEPSSYVLVDFETNVSEWQDSFRSPVHKIKQISALSSLGSSLPPLKILALDIESYAKTRSIDMKKNPIISVALHGRTLGKKAIHQKILCAQKYKGSAKHTTEYASEQKMLEALRDEIIEYSPDIITGFFSDGFDLPYIKERCEKHNIAFTIAKDKSELISPKNRAQIQITGIVHLDVFKFIKYIFGINWKIESYGLNAIAKHLFNEEKHDVNFEELAAAWDGKNKEWIDTFLNYNLQDSYLTYRITEYVLPAMFELSKMLSIPLFDVIRLRMSKLVESYLLKREQEFNVINPNKPDHVLISKRMRERYEGAFVLEPEPGLYKDVVVFDFLSLYPTIIISHNIGPETIATTNSKGSQRVPGMPYYLSTTTKSFIATVLGQIVERRVDLKKERKRKGLSEQQLQLIDSQLYSLKVLANSFYGYIGFYAARYYSFAAARSITAFARHYIKTVIADAKKQGFHVLYSDTDSIMISLEKKTTKDAHKFVAAINESLPGNMELEFEGFFPSAIFVASKGSERGAKKKYALRAEDDSLKIVGFETVRRNWSSLAKDAQKILLSRVLHDQVDTGIDELRSLIFDVKNQKLAVEKIIIKTKITRPLSSYKVIGPHVAVAQKLVKKGYPIGEGSIVEYVVTEGKGIIRERAVPVEDFTGSYDSEYYLKNQLLPAVEPILQVTKHKVDELFAKSSQKGLGDF